MAKAWNSDKQKLGRPYFVLSLAWFQAWCEYSLFDRAVGGAAKQEATTRGNKPPSIDNSELLAEDAKPASDAAPTSEAAHTVKVRRGLVERYDYILVPPLVWLRLWAWYGGGPWIKRVVIRSALKEVVDLYPVDIQCDFSERSADQTTFTMQLPSNNTFRNVRHWACTAYNRAPHKCEVILKKRNENGAVEDVLLNDQQLKTSLEDMGITESCSIFIKNSVELDAQMSHYGGFGSGSFYSTSWAPMKPPENEIGEVGGRFVFWGSSKRTKNCLRNLWTPHSYQTTQTPSCTAHHFHLTMLHPHTHPPHSTTLHHRSTHLGPYPPPQHPTHNKHHITRRTSTHLIMPRSLAVVSRACTIWATRAS